MKYYYYYHLAYVYNNVSCSLSQVLCFCALKAILVFNLGLENAPVLILNNFMAFKSALPFQFIVVDLKHLKIVMVLRRSTVLWRVNRLVLSSTPKKCSAMFGERSSFILKLNSFGRWPYKYLFNTIRNHYYFYMKNVIIYLKLCLFNLCSS